MRIPHAFTDELFKRVNQGVDLVHAKLPAGRFWCNVCASTTRLAPQVSPTGNRRWARCPRCGAMERHRLQAHVLTSAVLPRLAGRDLRVLHVAPELSIQRLIRPHASAYVTADYSLPGMDLRLDLRDTGLEDESFDLVYASHVLEHIDDDTAAIREIARILVPGGIAVLPVPMVGSTTVEYPAPNPVEAFHVRAPGYDYADRYRPVFAEVELFTSADAPAEIQPFIVEDRSAWPTSAMPLRTPSRGLVHLDVVPVCRR